MSTLTNFQNNSLNSRIKLKKPNLDNPATLMNAFKNRQSIRSFSSKPLSEQELSDLLWVASGINRENGFKTVPLLGDIGIYIAMGSGVYLYDATKHELELKIASDIRGELSPQDIVKSAPLVFIMTIDDSSFPSFMKDAMEDAHGMDFYYGNQVAYSTQNISLYAASNNMNSLIVGGIFKEKIDEVLKLKEGHHTYLIQLVAYKK